MAAPKRECELHAAQETNGNSKKPRLQHGEEACQAFLQWCEEHKLTISKKVRIGKDGSVSQYGMMAVEDIEFGESLFEIQRSLLLSPTNCSVSNIIVEDPHALESNSGWLPLLVALMYEYTTPASKWRPYFDLVPDFDHLDPPMFWPREEVNKSLKGTGVPEAVRKDVNSIEKEFHDKVVPFVKKHPETFKSERCQDVNFFKQMVAFVMAYSFTEPPPEGSDDDEDDAKQSPMMVPMADVLNHIAKSNAHLEFYPECLKMEATRPIKKGEEVYNTYGELPNWQLLQMYGFAEKYPENHYDTVDISMTSVLETLKKDKSEEQCQLITEKWNFLKSIDIITDQGMFVLGVEGILTEEEMHTTLKVMTMDKAAFVEYKEKEGWSEDEDGDDQSESLTFDDIPSQPDSWKSLLKEMAEGRLQDYPRSLQEEEKLLKQTRSDAESARDHYACLVRYGQLQLLTLLIETCSSQ